MLRFGVGVPQIFIETDLDEKISTTSFIDMLPS